jgi:glycosyltransferase involved in cell wall biosynthesis
MTIFGILRIKNEGRWIRQVLKAAAPLCERIFILDDRSTDGTPELCRLEGEHVTVIESSFDGFDESRDREYLLSRVMGSVGDCYLKGDVTSPYWALAIDGDELLDPAGIDNIRATIRDTEYHAFKLPIRYLWNSDLSLIDRHGHRTVRTDGVYRTFARPSLFRLFNRAFQFQRTPFGNGANFHCSSIPQELLHHSHQLIPGAPLWHLGYNDREDRIRKYHWYNKLDPNNEAEDCYRHMVQGDLPEVHPSARLKHAGPFEIQMM